MNIEAVGNHNFTLILFGQIVGSICRWGGGGEDHIYGDSPYS